MDLEFDFSEIVDALDPNDPINNQPLSVDIGVECTNHANYTTSNTIANHRPRSRQQSASSSVDLPHNHRVSRSIKTKRSASSSANYLDLCSTSSYIKKANERDLKATNELLNNLKHRKQEKMYQLTDILRKKANGNVFTTHVLMEPTLRCPWCGDHKGYRYFTKHLSLKCNARDINMNQNTLLNVRKRRKRSIVNYKQFMDNNDEEEDGDDDAVISTNHEDDETEDEYVLQTVQRYESKKNNRTSRARRNHSRHPSDDDAKYSPRRRTKRKR